MKKKDITYLIIAAVIFVIVGFVGYSQLGGKSSSSKHTAQVDVVVPISSDFDTTALGKLQDPGTARDFYTPIDLNSGLNNSNPFNPI